MVRKQVIFNVGGALSSFLKYDDHSIVIDLGSSSDFDPVSNFLIPLGERGGIRKYNESQFFIDQIFLSHLDDDHISSIIKYDEKFFSKLYTAPCINEQQNEIFHINKDLVKNRTDERLEHVLNIMSKRSPGRNAEAPTPETPLESLFPEIISLYHIPATLCEEDNELKESYSNNTSLVLFIHINETSILAPGDLMKRGFEVLLEREPELVKQLSEVGVDFLIAPHHGLRSSFSELLFQKMRNNKTNCLNIISEKLTLSTALDNRFVDNRYQGSDYSNGCIINGELKYSRKTSNGHIVIDFETSPASIKIISTDDHYGLINEFL